MPRAKKKYSRLEDRQGRPEERVNEGRGPRVVGLKYEG